MSDEELIEKIADEISGIAVGEGYYSQTIGIDAALEAAKAIAPLLNRVRAEALREAGEEVEGWRQKITTAQIEANRGYLPVVQSALVGGMMQAEDILTKRADRIEQNSEGNET